MSEMTPERWQRIRAILERALEATGSDREAVLQQACGDDGGLRAEVEALLEAESRGGRLLDAPMQEYAGSLIAEMARHAVRSGSLVGEELGPYRLERELARGGMGTVYLAERADGQFAQRVAIKVLRRGLDTDDLLRRFLAERQILASLAHPNIARLLDGGATPDGRPYLVMEYVDGQPIDAYCDERRLPVGERLALFVDVARAVQYAHRKLVVHRDLKPSNILVSAPASEAAAGTGAVKLLDFGIAKLLSDTGESGAALTRTGVIVLTPDYASPEQVRGEPVTTASDVYQLGLLLYELLTGQRPYRLSGRAISDVERIVCEQEPPRPSTAVLRAAEGEEDERRRLGSPQAIAAARRTHPERLSNRLRGDLDAITLMALRKEPERRYASVEAMVEDVERHRAGLPVRARGDSRLYRGRRFVARHRWPLAAVTLILLLLAGYAATASIQANRTRIALDRAQLEAEKAEQITDFLLGLFEASRPEQARGEEVTARELLERGVERAEALEDQPEVQARLLAVIGKTYHRLGRFEEAQPLYERALTLRERHFGAPHEQIAESLSDLAVLFRDWGDYAAAEPLQRRALAMRRELLGELHEEVAVSLDELGRILQDLGDYAAAEPLFREGLVIRRSVFGNDHNETASSLNSVGLVLRSQGRHDEAERYFREALAINLDRFGDTHPWVASIKSNLALIHIERGDWADAESLLHEALDADRRTLGETHASVALRLNHLGTVYRGQERYAEADSLLRQAVEMARGALGDSHTLLAHFLANHARLHLDVGNAAAAEHLAREALEIFTRALAAEDWRIRDAEGVLGQALASLGRIEEAEPLVLRSHAALQRRWGDEDRRTREALARLDALRASAALRERY